ncbi:MAG: alpha/beta hydrolase fold domain-containing protein [Candidatus Eremiobacteraeota bacterium]|nr:alpha/beta hydrolase fold domain-containing protein [Candidatus Eremiobacteraeota bacterium]
MDLSDQYDTSKQVRDGDVQPYFDDFNAASERARAVLRPRTNVRYGPHERETVDFFAAPAPGAPLFVWVHGGYWRRMSKDAFSFIAEPIVLAGGAVAILNYPLAPGPTLDDIVASVRRGFAFSRSSAGSLLANPARTFVGGHSVGAQLAAMIAANEEVSGMLALSGLYDLEPLRRTHINAWIAMDAAIARRNSPLYNRPRASASLVASVGSREQAAFHTQQRAYVAAWRSWGAAATEVPGEGHDHFSIVRQLGDATAPLTGALLAMMSLG